MANVFRYAVLSSCLAVLLHLIPISGFGAPGSATEPDCLRDGTTPPTIAVTPVYGPYSPTSQLPLQTTQSNGIHSRAHIATGSPYQVLDWLENGKVDGAILSPFSLKLVELELTDHFDDQFMIFDSWIFDDRPLNSYIYMLRYWHSGTWQDSPWSHFLNSLSSVQKGSEPIYVPSHLSAGLAVLVSELRRWKRDDISRPELEQKIWRRFVERLRFRLTGTAELSVKEPDRSYFEITEINTNSYLDCDSGEVYCLSRVGVQDYLVLRNYLKIKPHCKAMTSVERKKHFAQWNYDLSSQRIKSLPQPLRSFFASNYRLRAIGFERQRNYRFTLEELWTILSDHDSETESDSLALILSGGGVKGAYQTVLVDHLYKAGYLQNTLAPSRNSISNIPGTLTVNYIIGTSGGALLGVFASAIDRIGDRSLVRLIWGRQTDGNEGEYIDSQYIFPLFDLPRYASWLVTMYVFWVVCWFALHVFRFRKYNPRLSRSSSDEDAQRKRVSWVSYPWTVMLLASPWIVKFVNGEAGLEHVPAVAGMFFSVYLLIGIYTDNRLIFGSGSGSTKALERRVGFVFVVGIVLTFFPLLFGEESQYRSVFHVLHPLLGGITLATLTTCIGLLLISVCMYFAAAPNAEKIGHRHLADAALTLFSVPVGVYFLLIVFDITTFELAPEFWTWLIGLAAGVSIAVFMAARWSLSPSPVRKSVAGGLDFLLDRHPGRIFGFATRRVSRLLLFAFFAWAYWNAVNAPALYGNESAKRYFEDIVAKIIMDDECGFGFEAPFVMSATSLDRRREVYFFVYPSEAREREETRDSVAPNWREVDSDPRWIEIGPVVSTDELRSVAFASGSPFPVFPMTKVLAPARRENCGPADTLKHDSDSIPEGEWLIDGGYAHNVPMDAARQLGATRLLTISASPLHPEAEKITSSAQIVNFGAMIRGLRNLFPYFFSRSQVEDSLGTEGVLVAALSPDIGDVEWPMLVDFRDTVVDTVIGVAKENINNNRRIGTIESWGPPFCLVSGKKAPCDS